MGTPGGARGWFGVRGARLRACAFARVCVRVSASHGVWGGRGPLGPWARSDHARAVFAFPEPASPRAILRARQAALDSPLLLAPRSHMLSHRPRMEPGYSLNALEGEGREKGGVGGRVRGLPALPRSTALLPGTSVRSLGKTVEIVPGGGGSPAPIF